jgi:hypothetical protein
MALKPEDYDFLSNMSALWSIIIGALLATAGGLVGTQLEWFLERQRRERDAALFFAEVLSTLKIILDLAADTKRIGDPYGPITLRMLRSARREIEIYERNRENLYALRDGNLRARIHTSILRMTMPLEGVFDSSVAIETITAQLKAPHIPEAERAELERRLTLISENREGGYGFVMDTAAALKDVIADLSKYSGHDHETIQRVVNST